MPTYFDAAWRDENSGLNIAGEGCVTLNGSQALAYARARHLEYLDPESGEWESDPTGDLGRMNRQQLLVTDAVDAAVSLDLANPAHLNRLVNVGVDNVGVDPGFSFDDMVALSKAFAHTGSDRISRHGLPVEDYRTDGMLVCKLLLSPMPHCRVRRLDVSAALAVPGVKAVLTADYLPPVQASDGTQAPERALTNEPVYQGKVIGRLSGDC